MSDDPYNPMDTGQYTGVPLLHKGEHTTANPPAQRVSRRQRLKSIEVKLSGELYDFLVANAENNERDLAQEVRFWLKKATGIK